MKKVIFCICLIPSIVLSAELRVGPYETYSTIQAAADVAQAGDTIIISEGVYRESIRPANSGTESSPITFKAASGAAVVIDGREPITGWTQHQGNIYVADVPGDFYSAATGFGSSMPYDASVYNYSDQIFVDDQVMILARWPNDTIGNISFPVKAQTDEFISKTRNDNWTTGVLRDADLVGFDESAIEGADIYFQADDRRAWAWVLTGYVSNVDSSNGQLTFRTRSDIGEGDFSPAKDVYDHNSRYYFFNKLELLDTEGEWFHDKDNGKLYFWAPNGVNPNTLNVSMKKRTFAFDLTNRSHITLRNLKIIASTITTDTSSGGDNVPYDASGNVRYPWRNPGYNQTNVENFNHASSSHVELIGLEIDYPTHFVDVSGHNQSQWAQSSGIILSGNNHTMRDSIIRYSAGNGLSLMGYHHQIFDNEIYDTNYQALNLGAITFCGTGKCAHDIEVGYNTIKRTGRHGIHHGNLFRRDINDGEHWKARIHHNDISEFGMQTADVGGTYSGGIPGFVRIDHNWIHNAAEVDNAGEGNYTASGIYPDYGAQHIIHHNVIWNLEWGIHIQNQNNAASAADFIIYNNTVRVNRMSNDTVYGPFGVVNNSSADHQGTVIVNNIFWNSDNAPGYRASDISDDQSIDRIVQHNLEWDNTSGSATDPRFLNPDGNQAHDFRLSSGSIAEDRGIEVPDYLRNGQRIPAFNDAFEGTSPDQGAYEQGGINWTAGRRIYTTTGPSVGFTMSANNLQVSFTSSVTDGQAPFTYDWNFGDGNSSTEGSPTHTYSAAGNYTVSLIVTDNQSQTDTATQSITVADSPSSSAPPTVSVSNSINQLEVTFMSTVNDGEAPFTYEWDFGDGNASSDSSPTHTYSAGGTYTVNLTVSDNQNRTVSTTLSVTVAENSESNNDSSGANYLGILLLLLLWARKKRP